MCRRPVIADVVDGFGFGLLDPKEQPRTAQQHGCRHGVSRGEKDLKPLVWALHALLRLVAPRATRVPQAPCGELPRPGSLTESLGKYIPGTATDSRNFALALFLASQRDRTKALGLAGPLPLSVP